MKEFTGKITGYDPGGNGRHGVAALIVNQGQPTHLDYDTVRNAEAAWQWLMVDGTIPVAIGVDALTMFSTGDNGYRPADRWLRNQYPQVANKVMPPNSLQGAMMANGLTVVSRLQEANPNIVVSETHPKCLYYHLTGDPVYDYEPNRLVMNERLARWIEVPVNTEDDHQWDAVISCMAVLQGITGQWSGDLHSQLPFASDETQIRILGRTHYYWPIIPDRRHNRPT